MKLSKPLYANKFVKSSSIVELSGGERVTVYSIATNLTDAELNEWAKHILAHYVSHEDIREGAKIQKVTEEEYIENFILPSLSIPTQVKDVSGNFGEIVFCDFIEYVMKFTVPRYKLYNNPPGNPTQGIDIVAYRKDSDNTNDDAVLFSETKAILSEKKFKTLQEAIDQIEKRQDRDFALALDQARRRLTSMGDIDEALEIGRFSDSERPCRRLKGAGLITSADNCETADLIGINVRTGNKIEIYVIHADDLWNLAKDLWRRAKL